jgi:hypothetical protein
MLDIARLLSCFAGVLPRDLLILPRLESRGSVWTVTERYTRTGVFQAPEFEARALSLKWIYDPTLGGEPEQNARSRAALCQTRSSAISWNTTHLQSACRKAAFLWVARLS